MQARGAIMVQMDISAQAWARLRFSIIGPLLAMPPKPRKLHSALRQLAENLYTHPATGQPTKFSQSTIERWYYLVRNAGNPMTELQSQPRKDRGTHPSVCPEAAASWLNLHRQYPSWTWQLVYDNALEMFKELKPKTIPSYPTMVRYMQAQGLHRSSKVRGTWKAGEIRAHERREAREIRSYEVSHVHACWHLDFHAASRSITTPTGDLVTPQMLCIIDDHSRLVCHAQWYWEESAASLVHGLMQAMMKRGLPRTLFTDNGGAMLASETTSGLERLSVTHQTTLAYSPYQNGKQEVFWSRIEGRLLPMMERMPVLTLEALNDATQAWVELDYQILPHRELDKKSPRERALSSPSVARPCPDPAALREAFTQQQERVVRRSDGTIALAGRRYEVPDRLRALRKLSVRYARWDMAHVWAADPKTGVLLAPLHLLDKRANADRQRRPRANLTDILPHQLPLPVENAPAPLLQRLMQDYASTGLPPAYISSPIYTGKNK